VVEDRNVAGMLKNHSLAEHLSDASWGEFVRQLEYKTQWYGSTLVKAPRFCGSIKDGVGNLARQSWPSDVPTVVTNTARTYSVAGRGGKGTTKAVKSTVATRPREVSTEPRPSLVEV
jgi:hypothetical protein